MFPPDLVMIVVRWSLDGFEVRPFARGDIESLVTAANDPHVARHLRDRFPQPYLRRHAQEWIDLVLRTDPPMQFALISEGAVAGGIGLVRQEDVHSHCVELGYWLGQSWWGRGWSTQAVLAITRHAFEELRVLRVFATVFSSNPASRRVLEKAGYQFEGALRRSVIKNGEELDQWVFAALESEWTDPGP